MGEPHFFEPRSELEVRTNRLPHWQQPGGIYFVTFRLADSLPAELLQRWSNERKQWLQRNPPPHSPEKAEEFQQLFLFATEQALDAGHGACALRERTQARVVAEALHFHEGRRSEMFSFVVMPNHVHALFGLLGEAEIQELVGVWKGYTSCVLARQTAAWPGWQKDYFDRLVRNETHFGRCVRYIRRNPEKAGLGAGEFLLWESERARAVE